MLPLLFISKNIEEIVTGREREEAERERDEAERERGDRGERREGVDIETKTKRHGDKKMV